jgi:hypothetical protein
MGLARRLRFRMRALTRRRRKKGKKKHLLRFR